MRTEKYPLSEVMFERDGNKLTCVLCSTTFESDEKQPPCPLCGVLCFIPARLCPEDTCMGHYVGRAHARDYFTCEHNKAARDIVVPEEVALDLGYPRA